MRVLLAGSLTPSMVGSSGCYYGCDVAQKHLYNKLNSDLPFKFTDTVKCKYLSILFHQCSLLSFLKNDKNKDSRFYQEADDSLSSMLSLRSYRTRGRILW